MAKDDGTIERAEKSVIGTLLLSPQTLYEIELSTEHFLSPKHRCIYAAICELSEDGEKVDPLSVEAKVAGKFEVNAVELVKFTDAVTSTQWIHNHAKMLRAKAVERDVRRRAMDIYKSGSTGEELLAEAQRSILEVHSTKSVDEAMHISGVVKEVVTDMERRRKGLAPPIGLSTGVPGFDRYLTLLPGETITIAARPNIGKTATLRWLSSRIMARNERILVFTTDSNRHTFGTQYLAMVSGVNSRGITHGSIGWEKASLVKDAGAEVSELPLWIDDKHNDIQAIQRQVRRYKARHQITTVVLDHLQEARDRRLRTTDRTAIVDSVIEGIRDVCREEPKCYFVLASQLNRDVEKREEKRPIMADLKQSGSIEEKSDMVLLLYRKAFYYPKADDTIMEVAVPKNRNGPTGVMTFGWDPDNGQCLGPLDDAWAGKQREIQERADVDG